MAQPQTIPERTELDWVMLALKRLVAASNRLADCQGLVEDPRYPGELALAVDALDAVIDTAHKQRRALGHKYEYERT